MEWWKLFSGTFILVFLAELGDKTQLAAMAKTADSPDNFMVKWVVFGAASLALVVSTFIAVFLGSALKSFIPDERYIKIAAGALFLIFGFTILYETGRSFLTRPEPVETERDAVPSAETSETPGLMGGLALRAAMDFEAFAGKRYRRLAANASQRLSDLLFELANEEDGHLAKLRSFPKQAGGAGIAEAGPGMEAPEIVYAAGEPETLAELIRHEESTADFYQSLADRTLIPSVKAAFTRLANEERGHAGRLSEMTEKIKVIS